MYCIVISVVGKKERKRKGAGRPSTPTPQLIFGLVLRWPNTVLRLPMRYLSFLSDSQQGT